MKNQKGITLIGLVITIIVILILAAVSIQTLTGEEGILERAENAGEEQNRATAEDTIKTEYSAILAETYSSESSYDKNIHGSRQDYALNTIQGQYTNYKIELENGSLKVESKNSNLEVTTLATVTTDNIGDYIDLGKNIVGTEATTDDWRILYVEGDTVYAILADYLPNSTGYATSAGLNTYDTYEVSSTSANALFTILTTTTNWASLANEINGATVVGTPSAELLINGYNAKNGTNLDPFSGTMDKNSEGYDIFVPPLEGETGRYWLSDLFGSYGLYTVSTNSGYIGLQAHIVGAGEAIRPVVSLPTSTNVTFDGEVWAVSQ